MTFLKTNPVYFNQKTSLLRFILSYDTNNNVLVNGTRNQIKIAHLDGVPLAIKSFKTPNYFNRLIYKHVRKTKARRSYEHAKLLLQKGIGTPKPVAYFKNYTLTGIKDTYYVSEYLKPDLTLRDLLTNTKYPDREAIFKQFTQFTYHLHKNGVEFLDHSPGNTLIKKASNGMYNFFLVDLNRMKFHRNMSFTKRMKNLRRLTPNLEIIKLISHEYAKLSGEPQVAVYRNIATYAQIFFQRFNRKRKIKAFLSLLP